MATEATNNTSNIPFTHLPSSTTQVAIALQPNMAALQVIAVIVINEIRFGAIT